MLNSYQINSKDVAFDIIEAHVLVINLRTGKYFHLVDSAAMIWRYITESKNVSEIETLLFSHYDVQRELLTREVKHFINELLDESLIFKSEDDSELASIVEVLPGKNEFKGPALEVFTDLQEFLLLDPIHEISNLGLPSKQISE
jgi:Coenzyme PQQ synthesis protein D (PqqD)